MQLLSRLTAGPWGRVTATSHAQGLEPPWPDMNEPGSMAAPRAVDGDEEQPGLRRRQRVRSASAPPPAAPAAPARPPRTPRPRLCERTSRWLRAGLALLGGVALFQATWRHGGLPGGPGLPPGQGPFDARNFSLGSTSDAATCEAAAGPPAEMPLLPGPASSGPLDQVHAPAAGVPDGGTPAPPTLTDTLETIFAGDEAEEALRALLEDLGTPPCGSLPLAEVDRVVDAFRGSRLWREARPMRSFIKAMVTNLDLPSASDAHLARLLRVWSWRYGDVSPVPGQAPLDDHKLLSNSIILTVSVALGDSLLTDMRLGLVIATATQEPEEIPSGSVPDRTLVRHAEWAATAFHFVMRASLRPSLYGPITGPITADPAQVLRCLRLLIRQPARDPRWRKLVLLALDSTMPRTVHGPLLTQAKWHELLLQAVHDHLAAIAPGLPRPATLDKAIAALNDPGIQRNRLVHKVVTRRPDDLS